VGCGTEENGGLGRQKVLICLMEQRAQVIRYLINIRETYSEAEVTSYNSNSQEGPPVQQEAKLNRGGMT
jgi:hypothetical protein